MSKSGSHKYNLKPFYNPKHFYAYFFYSKSFVHIDILLLCLIDTSYNKLKKFPP